MDIMETLKQLVNTDDKMARMEIVEAFEMPEGGEGDSAELETTLAEVQEQLAELQVTLQEKDQKYIDTFFGDKEPEGKEEKKEDAPKEDKKSLDDIEKEMSPK